MKTPKKDRLGFIYKYPSGTKVKIKDSVPCSPIFKQGGKLIFRAKRDVGIGQFRVGILIEGLGAVWCFHPNLYEVINYK